jgi:hypothetical protein
MALSINQLTALPLRPQAADPQSLQRFAAWPSIRVLHCLIGGAWCIALILQLWTAASLPAWGGAYARRARLLALHRASGQAMLVAAAAVTAGYVIMELGHKQVMRDHGALVRCTFYRPLAAHFAATAARTALTAPARGAAGAKRAAAAAAHSAHAVRHAAAGLTFALARVLVLLLGFACHASGVLDMTQLPNKLRVFYVCAYSAGAVCVGGAELALQRRNRS